MTERIYTTERVSQNSINDRIKFLIGNILQITPYEFSKSLNKTRPDWLYKIIKNEVTPSPKTLDQIFSVYPEHRMWILTGESDKDNTKGGEGEFIPYHDVDKNSRDHRIESIYNELNFANKTLLKVNKENAVIKKELSDIRDLIEAMSLQMEISFAPLLRQAKAGKESKSEKTKKDSSVS